MGPRARGQLPANHPVQPPQLVQCHQSTGNGPGQHRGGSIHRKPRLKGEEQQQQDQQGPPDEAGHQAQLRPVMRSCNAILHTCERKERQGQHCQHEGLHIGRIEDGTQQQHHQRHGRADDAGRQKDNHPAGREITAQQRQRALAPVKRDETAG